MVVAPCVTRHGCRPVSLWRSRNVQLSTQWQPSPATTQKDFSSCYMQQVTNLRHRETGTDFRAIVTGWDRCRFPQILVSLSMFPPEKHSEECCGLRSSTTKTPVLRRTRHVTTSSVTLPPRAPEPRPEISPSLHWRISCWPLDFPGSSRG